MAIGDDALADGLSILTGGEFANTLDTEVNRSRDFIAGRARKAHTHTRSDITDLPAVASANTTPAGAIPVYDAGGRLTTATPTDPDDAATKAYVDARPQIFTDFGTYAKATKNVGTATDLFADGTIHLYGVTPVTSGYRALYINSDGRTGVTPSARKYKKDIRDHAYTPAQLYAIRIVYYRLRAEVYGAADAPVEAGVIADELVAAGLSEFVIFNDEGEPESVHYERLVLVVISVLQHALADMDALTTGLDLLEQRLSALENR